MKKSNIILLSLFLIALATIIIVQLTVKSTVTDIEEFDYQYIRFSRLEVQSGWIVELQNDSLTKITVNNDSIKEKLSHNGDILTLKKNQGKRNIVRITNPLNREIHISGNSTLTYYTKSDIDSLKVTLNETGDIIIRNKKQSQINSDKKVKNTINFLSLEARDNSRLNIYTHVNMMEGVVADTSSLYISGSFKIKNMEKSENARINSW